MSVELRPPLVRVVERLLASEQRQFVIDEIAEAIGQLAVTPPEIDEIMRRLETAGREIADSDPTDLQGLLASVIETAKMLRERGDAPNSRAIARHLDIEESAVRTALLFAQTLGRGSRG